MYDADSDEANTARSKASSSAPCIEADIVGSEVPEAREQSVGDHDPKLTVKVGILSPILPRQVESLPTLPEARSFTEIDARERVERFYNAIDGEVDNNVDNEVETGVDIGKAWATVGWLFLKCGLTQAPILGGNDHIGEDFGCGPLIHFTPTLVRNLSTQIAAISEDMLDRALDLSALTGEGTYPNIWDRAEEAEDNRRWILDEAEVVADLYSVAATNGNSILTYIG